MKTNTDKKIMNAITAQLIQKRKQALKQPFQSFTNIAHRMQQVHYKNGTTYINDSKAENTNATFFALQSIRKPIIWIAGGDDYQTDYWDLMSLVRQKVDSIIMIGENNERLFHIFSPVINHIYKVKDMGEAVIYAKKLAREDSTVLLSPACKPDHRFMDYQDRGKQFIKAVNKL